MLHGYVAWIRTKHYNFGMDEKIDNQDHEIDLRTAPEIETDRKVESLEVELAQLQPGVQVIIERLRPAWCKGQLEKITVGDEGLDLDYLIRMWGGHLLSIKIVGSRGRIKGSHTVELYSWPPRRNGKILRAPNFEGDDEAGIANPPPLAAQPFPSEMFGRFFDMLNKQRQSEVDTLRQMLLAQMQMQSSAPTLSPSPQKDPLAELVKASKYYNQLKGLFGESQPASSEDALPAQIMDMAKMFFEERKQPRAALTDPPSGRQLAPQFSPPSKPKNATVTPIPRRDTDLSTQISGMSPDAAADTLITALGKMDQDKQDKTIESFLDKFRNEMPEFFEDDAADDDVGNSGGN
jgi:hypothetical protein